MTDRDQNLVFRGLVLATLVWAAIGFGLYEKQEPANRENQPAAKPEAPSIELRKGFWAKTADDPTAFFTAALAALTAVLASVGAVQIYFFETNG